MSKVTWPQIAAWRATRHHLVDRASANSMLAVAARLCGLHAQVMSSAELSLWARVEDLDRDAVAHALWRDRTLVKTWAMRGTLHLLPASELSFWHAALRTSNRYRRPALWRRFGLTLAELDALTEAIGVALHNREMTREELAREVGRITGKAALGKKLAASSWGTILKPAAFTGSLCFAPSAGQLVRFTRPDTWIPAGSADRDPHPEPPDVARRFLSVYGPATLHDLARWWGGGGVANARQWIGALGDEVCPVALDGGQAWMLAAHARELHQLAPIRSARLLPAFDPYVIAASRHAERLLPGNLRHRVYRQQGWISPVLLVNGRMEGIWRHDTKGSRVEVTIEPFVKVPAWVRRDAVREAERLAAFLGRTLSLAWKS